LVADGAPVELGARTLDLLIALASRPNEPVAKRELLAQVWPDVTVEEGSLRFHIAALRKALGDGKDGARYIATLAGRGYCFVAPVTRNHAPEARSEARDATIPSATFLPARLARMVGREAEIHLLSKDLLAARFLSIVGPGGVGKTTVAVAVAHELLETFGGDVLFVDFGLVTDPRVASSSVASMMGLSIQSDDPIPNLIALLRDRRMLLVLDTCEHIVEELSRLTERLFLAAPRLHILTTSREALRVEGERVHRLGPLGFPSEESSLTATDTLEFPATRLFVERAIASGARIDFEDANAAIVAGICRKMEGMALAIELAAGRVATFGLEQTAALLDQRFTLLWPGQRTAPARQKTLQATLEWSYGLLPEAQRIVFRRLCVFVGAFTIEAALEVVTDEIIDAAWVFEAIDSLVAKSMVTAFPRGGTTRYKLLDVTRTFIRSVVAETGELAAHSKRHAAYCLSWLERASTGWTALSNTMQWATLIADLNDLRAALSWCFEGNEAQELGVDLAAAAAPVFFAMSMLTECQRWSQSALLALDDRSRGTRTEMRLQAALGLALMWTQGNSPAARAALDRSFAIAEKQADASTQMQLLAPLHVYSMRIGEFRTAAQYAERVAKLSKAINDPTANALSQILSGYSFHFAGELAKSRQALEAALNPSRREHRAASPSRPPVLMRDDAMAAPILTLAWSAAPSALARTLWLQGHPAAALEYVRKTVADAARSEHPVTLLVALMYSISVLLWNGDHDEAEAQIARFQSIVESSASPSHILLGACFQAQLAIARGDNVTGVKALQPRLHELRAQRYELWTTAFNISLIEAYAASGQVNLGLAIVDETIRSVESNGDLCYMAELLRMKAQLLFSLPKALTTEGESCLKRSLEIGRRQGARAWELRTCLDLGRRMAAQGRPEKALARVRSVFEQFPDGSASADLRTAIALMASWEKA
jgi:predicted ATPase/DNA-binding winged helix-turn-helix (wHTH) protein